MSIWKRLSAATSNLTIGSPIARLLAGDGEAENTSNRLQSSEKPDNEVPFTLGIIALSAKMAKADGRVTRDEVEAFKGAFRVSPGEMKEAARAFNLAKRDVTGYEVLASELVELFKGNRKLLEDVLDGLFHIAKADEEAHPREEQFLVRSRTSSVSRMPSSITLRHATWLQLSAILTRCWASTPLSAMKN
jgi:DnaJ like chaperone protein